MNNQIISGLYTSDQDDWWNSFWNILLADIEIKHNLQVDPYLSVVKSQKHVWMGKVRHPLQNTLNGHLKLTHMDV